MTSLSHNEGAGSEVLHPRTAASAAAAPSGSGGLPADVAELAALLSRPGRAAGVVAVEVTAPAAGVETEAFNQAGPAASTAVEPVSRDHRCVSRRADVPAAVSRANRFTPRPAGVATWR